MPTKYNCTDCRNVISMNIFLERNYKTKTYTENCEKCNHGSKFSMMRYI